MLIPSGSGTALTPAGEVAVAAFFAILFIATIFATDLA
jgi:hypothetical protein